MKNRSVSFRLVTVTLIISALAAIAALGATSPAVKAFDSVKEFFGMASTTTPTSTTAPVTQSAETNNVAPMEPMFFAFGPTTLIIPTGDGGFETGATFAANNWTVVNHTTNTWQVGTAATASAGTRGAYVSNNGGTTWAYTNSGSQTSHFYRDVTVPATESNINLSFQWKGNGEGGFDRLLVYTAPTSITPVAGSPVSNSTTLSGATLAFTQPNSSQASYTSASVVLPASLAGTTFRLIFTWQNDGSAGTSPGAAIDQISLTSSTPGTPVPMATQAGLTYTENFADIANWTNNFAAGVGASPFTSVGVITAGAIPDPKTTTVSSATFASAGTTGGLQRGSLSGNPAGSIVMLSTGASPNTTAVAFDFLADFTGVNAGTLSFSWARVDNSATDRSTSLKVYTSTDGTNFTELVGAAVANVVVGGAASGNITSVALPASFNGSSTARLRFYDYNGTLPGTAGTRPKIAIDNLNVTATSANTPTKLAITSIVPSSPVAGSGFDVTVQSQDGSSVASNVTTSTGFTLSNTGGGSIAGGTTTGTINAASNTVTVTGVKLSSAGTGVTLTATQTSGTPSLTAGTSAPFTVLAVADHLTFVGVPTTGNAGSNLTTFTVEARRPDNTVDTNYTGNITVAKATGTGALSGTTPKAAVAGVATFNDLQFNTADTYTLAASASGLTGDTSGNILVGAAVVTVTASAGTATGNYSTLKAAFDAINAGTHQGDVVVNINGNTSEGATPATLNSSGAGSASYTSLLVRPTVDGVSISGTPATGFGVIQLKGADNVTIDGDNPNSGGVNRNLSVLSTSSATTGLTSLVRITTVNSGAAAGADTNTIKNLILTGNATGRNASGNVSTSASENNTFGVMVGGNGGSTATDAPIAATSVTGSLVVSTGVSGLVVDNNAINACARGVAFLGSGTSSSTGVTISNNLIGDQSTSLSGNAPFMAPTTTVYTKGVYIQGTDAVSITGNTFKNILSYVGTTMSAIELNSFIGSGIISISNNTIDGFAQNAANTSAPKAILVSAAGGAFTISGNTLSNLQWPGSSTTAATVLTGIDVTSSAPSATVELNKITKVYNTNSGAYNAYGINLAGGNNITVRNNFVSDINVFSANTVTSSQYQPVGIRVVTGTGHKIYHNSVHLFGAPLGGSSANGTSALMIVSTGSTGMDIRNNILANQFSGWPSGTVHAAIYMPSTLTSTFNLIENNNAYYAPTGSFIAQLSNGTTYSVANFVPASTAGATNWRNYTSGLLAANTNNDNASFGAITAAPFVSSTNLHIKNGSGDPVALVARAGVTIAGLTTDIDGDTRKATPDIGADDFITYTLNYTAGAGGTLSGTASQIVNPAGSGSAVDAVPDSGFAFVNWSDTSTADPRTDSSVSADISVTANFAITQYNLSYDGNGSDGGTTPATQTGDYNTTLTVRANTFTRTLYDFTGWNTAADGSGTTYQPSSTFTIPASNTILYAQWSLATLTTSTSITSSSPLNTSTFGGSVTFTATVTTPGPVAVVGVGTITIYDNNACSGTILAGPTAPDSNGRLAVTTAALTGGSHPITACYSGATGFTASNGSVTQTVNPANQTITVDPGVFADQDFSFGNYSWTSSASSGLPVVITSDTTGVCTIGNSAVSTVTFVTLGTCTIRVSQGGDGNYNAASPEVTRTFDIISSPTTTAAVTANASVAYGASNLITATVTRTNNNTVHPSTGTTIKFIEGTDCATSPVVQTGVEPTSAGVVTFNTNSLNAGSHSITACFSGSATTVASQSSPVAQTITPIDQAALVITDPGTVTFGTTPTLVTTGGDGNGAVTFDQGVASPGCTITSGGVLTVVQVGAACSITATKAAEGNYNLATSAPRSITFAKATPTIDTAPSASNIIFGQTLASSVLSGGAATPSGGTFTFTTPSTAPATGTASHGITYTPSDTTNYNNASGSVSVTVNKATPTVTTPPTASDITEGQSLASSVLSGGSASVAGVFTFTTPATVPPVGTNSQPVTFTPSDTTNYNTASTSTNVTVNAASTTYTLTAMAGANGNFKFGNTLANGVTTVNPGDSRTYRIVPDFGYQIVDVLVDSVSVGKVASYTFSSVSANHTISATFEVVTNRTLTAGTLNSYFDAVIDVPVSVSDTTGANITSFDFSLNYDESKLEPVLTGVGTNVTITNGTLGTWSGNVVKAATGVINVSRFSATTPASGAGVLLYIRMHVKAHATTTAALTLNGTYLSGSFGTFAPFNGGAVGANAPVAGVVNINATATTTSVVTSGTPSTYGNSVTFTATVTTSTTPAVSGGAVTFYDGGASCASPGPALGAAVNIDGSGVAAISIAALFAGNHTIVACYGGTADFTASSGSVAQVVNPKSVTASVTADNKIYDGNDTAVIATCTIPGKVGSDDVACNAGGPNTFSDANVADGKTVTARDITLTGTTAGNYVLSSTTATTTADITKVTPTVTVTVGTYTYDGNPQGPTAYTTNPAGDTGTPTWSYVGVSGTTYGPSATRPTLAGSYTATVSLAADSNFNAASSSATAFTIGKGTSTIVVTGSTTFPYSGAPQGPDTSDVTGSTGAVTYSYVGVSGTTYTASATKPTAAGSYEVTATVAADSNYNGAVSAPFAFTISSGTVSGTINYYAGTLDPVSGVTVSGAGGILVSGTTNASGSYSITGFGAGSYTMTPSRAIQLCDTQNGVLIDDAALVSEYVVGLTPLSPTQRLAAKVSGTATANLSSFDAALIAQKSVGICDSPNISGRWGFAPGTYVHNPVTTHNDIYAAYLMGDVNGDWSSTAVPNVANRESSSPNAVRASLPVGNAQPGTEVTVPFRIDNLNGRSLNSYQFSVAYDPAVIVPADESANVDGTLSGNLNAVYNTPTPGMLRVGVYGAFPTQGDGVYVNLKFRVIGNNGSSSPLTISGFRFNRGTDEVTSIHGRITVGAAAADATLQGRVLTMGGRGVTGARVHVTSSTGVVRSAFTTRYGQFSVSGLAIGETYMVTVQSRRFVFTPRSVPINDSVTNVDFVAEQ